MTALLFSVLLPTITVGPAVRFDLGGPCTHRRRGNTTARIIAIEEAEGRGDWAEAIELQKRRVRERCDNAYRWFGLVRTLLRADRPDDAVRVLHEMYERGFELRPSTLGSNATVTAFLSSHQVASSPLGKILADHARELEARRAGYRKRLAGLPAAHRPSEIFVERDACPFECCTYRTWTVLKDTELVDRPNGKRVVGRANAGETVEGLTGEVHVRPLPLGVAFDHGELAAGDILFRLGPIGEGFYNYFYAGKRGSEQLQDVDYCVRPGKTCWVETVEPNTDTAPTFTWWVKVRTQRGGVGWALNNGAFGNIDACG